MPFIPKAVCKCGSIFKPYKNGAIVEMLVNGSPYYKIYSDKLKCKGCGMIIYTGFAKQPISEHYMEDYNDEMNRADIQIELN